MAPQTLTFDVTGMSCAACSARVEKTTAAVPGVQRVAVNLLKNTMEVAFAADADPQAVTAAIGAAVDAAGYGAYPRVAAGAAAPDAAADGTALPAPRPATDAAAEARKVQVRLVVSLVFCIPLFYLDMGHMWHWPLPAIFTGADHLLAFALAQLALVTPIIAVNFKFFRNGWKGLRHGAPNMDTLVGLGAAASTLYSLVRLVQVAAHLQAGDTAAAHAAAMDLYFESAGMILTLITLGKYFEARAKSRTTDSLNALMDLAPKTALVLGDDGAEAQVPIDAVQVGDVCVVRTGGTVPADGIVVLGDAALDESALTGESLPVDKAPGSPVTAGTLVTSGCINLRVTAVGADTALARIIKLVDDATSSKAPIQRIADRVSAVFVPVVIGIAVAVFAIWLLAGGGISKAVVHAISVLVISCPCALGLATPTAIMVGTGRGAKAGILIKNAETLEGAAHITTVVLDKTGTITAGVPQVTDVLPAPGVDRADLLVLARSIEGPSEHPLARALCAYCAAHTDDALPVRDFRQVAGQGVTCTTEGAPALAGNALMMTENGIDATPLADRAEELAAAGKTPLFFAWGGQLLGLVALADTVKPTSAAAVAELRAMGIRTVMLTGDNARTAAAVAAQVGVDDVVSDVLPEGKEAVIRGLQEAGARVAMVGDGINDAPALARADVGIAIGAGTDVAIESADLVLMRSDLLDVAAAIKLSRATLRNIKQNLFWALFYNVICIPVAAGALVGLGVTLTPDFAAAAMSCSSICVVSNALRLRGWKPLWQSEAAQAARQE